MRRTRIVSRLLYLEAECPLAESVFPLIADLIRKLAHNPAERGVIYARLTGDGQGNYSLREMQCFALDAMTRTEPQDQENKAA